MIKKLLQLPLDELQTEAFRLRKIHFGKKLTFSIPDTISYKDNTISLRKNNFPVVSITGNHCELLCEHCKGKLLQSMIPIDSPQTLFEKIETFRSNGSNGILISGGANREGEVPIEKFILPIKLIKENDPNFKIIVHTGFIKEKVAKELKDAGVDQILIDIIGDDQTIQDVYHLKKRVRDYENTLFMLKEIGHRIAPHIIIGHHFGEIKGEWNALDIISRVGVECIVIVVIKLFGKENNWKIPELKEISRLLAATRILNPEIPISLGCIRPSNHFKPLIEIEAIDSGVTTIAYPLQRTIEYAKEIGLDTKFIGICCSLC